MNRVSEQTSVHPSEAIQAGAKLAYSVRCYYARRSYRLQQSHDNVQQSLTM